MNTKKQTNPNSLANLRNHGRPKGILNKTTREIRESSARIIGDPDYLASLKIRLRDGKAPHMEVLLHHYAFGKPKETVKHEGVQPAKLVVTQIHTEAEMRAIIGAVDVEAGTEDDDES
jgi:hypothetical protein